MVPLLVRAHQHLCAVRSRYFFIPCAVPLQAPCLLAPPHVIVRSRQPVAAAELDPRLFRRASARDDRAEGDGAQGGGNPKANGKGRKTGKAKAVEPFPAPTVTVVQPVTCAEYVSDVGSGRL